MTHTRQQNEVVRQLEFKHLREVQREAQFKGLVSEAGDRLADHDLEEAAIRFANGDNAGAAAALLTALQSHQGLPAQAQVWASALFDLYRLTDQFDAFECFALDYAQRFGRSAPAWFSLPDLLVQPSLALAPNSRTPPASESVWECPVELDVTDLQALQVSDLSDSSAVVLLDWRGLKRMTLAAVPALAELFAQWCTQPVTLRFLRIGVLENHLRLMTPVGDPQVPTCCWQLRLTSLCLLRRPDEFEQVALDFCLTYERSPPPWVEACCVLSGDAPSGWPNQSEGASTMTGGSDVGSVPRLALRGELLGDVTAALDRLQVGEDGPSRISISCALLVRVDFSAAGSLLDWLILREAQGFHVQFLDVPLLVAAFFNVIGINQHAGIIRRTR